MRRKPKLKGNPARTITSPASVREIIDQVTSDDRRWFEEHEEDEVRIRPAVAGEFWPVFESASVLYVIVMQVRLGWRLHAPVARLHMPQTERVQ